MSTVVGALPAWALPDELVAQWTLPFATPSQTVLVKMRSDEYRRLRERFNLLLRAAVAPFPQPLPRAGLVIVRRGTRALNWDNAYGGLKPLLDCLVARDAQHPAGLGYIKDESATSGLPFAPWLIQEQAAPEEQTLLHLYRIR